MNAFMLKTVTCSYFKSRLSCALDSANQYPENLGCSAFIGLIITTNQIVAFFSLNLNFAKSSRNAGKVEVNGGKIYFNGYLRIFLSGVFHGSRNYNSRC